MSEVTPVRRRWGLLIRRYRRFADVTQEELAAQLGVSTAAVTGWERGVRTPSPDMIDQLVRVLSIPPEELFQDADEAVA